jgi:hypothetical protein
MIVRLQRFETHKGCLAPSAADFAQLCVRKVRKVCRRLSCPTFDVMEGRVNLRVLS